MVLLWTLATLIACEAAPNTPGARFAPLYSFRTSTLAIGDITTSVNGRRLVSFDGQSATVFQMEGARNKTYPLPKDLIGEKIYGGVHFSEDSWLMVLGRQGFQIQEDEKHTRFLLYDFAKRRIVSDWAGLSAPGWHLALSRNKKVAFSASSLTRNPTITAWQLPQGKKLQKFQIDTDKNNTSVTSLATNGSGTLLAVGTNEPAVRILDVKSHKVCAIISSKGIAGSLCFASDTMIAIQRTVGIDQHRIDTYCLMTKSSRCLADYHSILTSPVALPSRRMVAYGFVRRGAGHVALCDIQGCTHPITFCASDHRLASLIIREDENLLITYAIDGAISFWDLRQLLGRFR